MGKIAFLFAGQGAQYPGMGKSLTEISPKAASLFELADSIRPGTSRQCFEGDPAELTQTANTQPCVFTVDLAAAYALEEAGVHADVAAGFSLGEMAALTFAGSFSEKDGFSLVCRRGELMQEAAQEHPSAMAAVLKLKDETVEQLCAGFPDVYPVNYNCPGQLVVAGGTEHLEQFCELAAEAGGRAKKLAVGGGFHSPFMEQAASAYLQELLRIGVNPPRISVYGNRTAAPYEENREIMLAEQMKNPVLWTKTVERMAADGVDTFVEVGPGKTLSGLVKRILPHAAVYRVEDAATLEETIQALRKTGGQE
ncbi:MAG TPA: ACP S-malonyltransferase [Candidatus Caccousia avicola]|uniref:Malonyl CoA-acyl carrier protein transacylase n=1 Tax=Candidatus Caccousia avicola TaxID=2840721 RepID=A0A9D1ALV2_9FIRM|nr:ACP S-malonyltransferase [Candidatus Caccousia avicola]